VSGWAVVLDFDGTITTRDISDAILNRYGRVTERDIEDSCKPGVITEAWVRDKFRRVRCSPRTLRRYILEIGRPRSGFREFAAACTGAGVPMEIVSGGVDLYLDLLLETWGAPDIKRFRAQSRHTSRGISVRYPWLKGRSLESFKRGRVRAHQRRGRRVIFAGDGTSDLGAALAADVRFVRGHLARLVRAEGVQARPLRGFGQLKRVLAGRSRRGC